MNVFKVILAVILVVLVFEIVLGIVGVVASTLGFIFEVAVVVALCLLAYRFFQKR